MVLRVRDRGIGIPAADRSRLFQAFERGSNTGPIPGTGLGLVVIRRCLDLQGGSIEIDSSELSGTTVTVQVPLFPTADTRARLSREAVEAAASASQKNANKE
jgi:signal transduction histidine kinase